MNIEEYTGILKNQIRDKRAGEAVADEIRGHIEDLIDANLQNGLDYDKAVALAVEEMGDPVSVGVELDRIHRPHMEWRFLIFALFIGILNPAVQYIISKYMMQTAGAGVSGNLSRVSIAGTVVGFAVMLAIYRLDYTILSGRGKIIGLAYIAAIIVPAYCFGTTINGGFIITAGYVSISVSALMILYLPLFAGILYDYRGIGGISIAKIIPWILIPVFIQIICGYIRLPSVLFMLAAEIILFILAIRSDWYWVDKKKTYFAIFTAFPMLIAGALVKMYGFNGYQRNRLESWLSHFRVGGRSPRPVDQGADYINIRLYDTFAKSDLIRKSDEAITIMKDIPTYNSNFILGSVSATCGIIAVVGIIACLFVLAAYIFRISLGQKNSLGYIVGCSCGIAIGLQSLCNVLIVLGILPLTESHLPFFTGGFAFSVVDYALLGLVLSIYRYKDIRGEEIPRQHHRVSPGKSSLTG